MGRVPGLAGAGAGRHARIAQPGQEGQQSPELTLRSHQLCRAPAAPQLRKRSTVSAGACCTFGHSHTSELPAGNPWISIGSAQATVPGLGERCEQGGGATAFLETPPLSCKLAEQEGNCWVAPDSFFAHLSPQLGGLRAGQHAWGDVHPGEGRVPSLGHLVQQLPERLLHVHASHQNGECSEAESPSGVFLGLGCAAQCVAAAKLQSFGCTAQHPPSVFPRRLRTTKSPSTSLLTSRATRWKSRRTMCPASGLMASATAWAACRCPVERKLGCSRGCLVPDSPPCPPQVAAMGSQADRKLCMAGFGGMVGFGGMAVLGGVAVCSGVSGWVSGCPGLQQWRGCFWWCKLSPTSPLSSHQPCGAAWSSQPRSGILRLLSLQLGWVPVPWLQRLPVPL